MPTNRGAQATLLENMEVKGTRNLLYLDSCAVGESVPGQHGQLLWPPARVAAAQQVAVLICHLR